ncbi:bifunctional diguanylate cyclase/phosphodiesterase [Bengtsoniella intestinalis]|uniref:putative bifunctional diguanylate cyclase/phosphodiesterase n=1 Tax=Bengtsoniella intestinalis TaxID=3073143 RepID=UPI00391FC813
MSDSVLRHSDATTSVAPTLWDLMKEHTASLLATVVLTAFAVIGSIYHQRRKLALIVNRDGLTGFYTQHKFTSEAKRLIAKSPNGYYVILAMDIDNFKYINEFFGYENGSKVLCTVGESIKGFCEKGTAVARPSADNFLILTRKDMIDGKFQLAKDHSGDIFAALKNLLGDMYNITFSVGLYEVSDKNLDLNFMIDCANMARYLGKGTADTTIHKFSPEMDTLRISNNDIVANMAKALDDQEFILLYQPKINLSTGELVGAEALVRWMRHGKMIPPDKFIPLFERNGFIKHLDYYVLDKACAFVATHPDAPKISVNLSGVTIMQSGFDRRILNIIDQHGIAHSQIDLEITETAFVEQFEESLGRIQNLRSKGITISMDDFGAGISSLSRLKNMPIDILKIDRAFIVDSIGNPRGGHIIKCVVQMAQKLNMETVAEGIETRAQEEFLHNLCCDVGQGYYFNRPLPENEFIKLLNQ